jgi:hypothetical protein
MAWTNISNANLDVGRPIRSVDILAIRDNISAVPNGDTNAPRIRAEALNGGQAGNSPIYAVRAWANIEGFGTSPALIRSGNVSSIVRNSTGDYTMNFSTAMTDQYFVVAGNLGNNDVANGIVATRIFARTTTSVRFGASTVIGGVTQLVNLSDLCVSILR